MNQLLIELIYKPNPYAEESQAYLDAWGQISIQIIEGDKSILLFTNQWDLALLAEWFADNQIRICKESLEFEGETPLDSESLAEAMWRLHQRDFEPSQEAEEFKWFTDLDDYWEHHNLRIGLIGSKIPNILIGCNHGVGEVSVYWGDDEWAYKFDMKGFILSFREEIRRFLTVWLSKNDNPEFQERIANILERIDVDLEGECCCE